MIFPITKSCFSGIAVILFVLMSANAHAEDFLTTKSVVKAEMVKDDPAHGKVVLTIEKGWHVNANTASMEFLIPTTIKSENNDNSLQVKYPPSKIFKTGLGNIGVYSGEVEIPFSFDKATKNKKIAVTAQACDEGTCYPPSTWAFELK